MPPTLKGNIAMTNEQIIFSERIELQKNGIIGTTGERMTVTDADGIEKEINEPEEIHTFRGWKERGRKIKRGEHAIACFLIWKHTIKKNADNPEEEKEKMFQTKSYWFIERQTEPIKK